MIILNKLKYSVALLLVFIQFSCDSSTLQSNKDEHCSQTVSDEFMPLSVGSFWAYDYKKIDGENVSYQEIRKYYINDTLTYSLDNKQYHVSAMSILTSSLDFMDMDYSRFYYQGSDGIYKAGFIFDTNLVLITPELLYKFPVNVGNSWWVKNLSIDSTQDSLIILSTIKYTCVATDELFVTPLDTFETIVYGRSSKMAPDVSSYWHYFDYFSPGIGLVGYDIYSTIDSTLAYEERLNLDDKWILRLTDYCIK